MFKDTKEGLTNFCKACEMTARGHAVIPEHTCGKDQPNKEREWEIEVYQACPNAEIAVDIVRFIKSLLLSEQNKWKEKAIEEIKKISEKYSAIDGYKILREEDILEIITKLE